MINKSNIEALGTIGKTKAVGVTSAYLEGVYNCYVLNEFWLFCDEEDTSVTPGLRNDGYWEPNITAWLLNNLRARHLFIDVGANCGYYTVLAARLGAYVIAYEPNPRYVRLLEENRSLNGFDYDIRNVALSDDEGTIDLYVPGDRHGDASVVKKFEDRGNAYTISVDVTSLDNDYDSAQDDRPFVLKIDVESAEEHVWRGATELLNSGRDGKVMIEWTPGSYSDHFFDDLKAWGKVVNYIDAEGAEQEATVEFLESQPYWTMVIVSNF